MSKLVAKSGRRMLLKYDSLPEYMKDNEYITDYYRAEWSLKDTALSVFAVHNETLNIWTHLIGSLIFLGLLFMSLTDNTSTANAVPSFFGADDARLSTSMSSIQSNASDASFSGSSYLRLFTTAPRRVFGASGANRDTIESPVPLWPWFVFLGGAMCCLIFSTVSHLLACHSRSFHYFFWRLDYTGISIMIVCSFFAPIYYMFVDSPYWRLAYLSTITFVGMLEIAALLAPKLSSGQFRAFRVTLFISMGFSGVIPASHAVILHWDQPIVLGALGYEILMGILYAVGAGIYVARVPERWRPGAFDIVGHSHQIFHVFVVAAAMAHAVATIMIIDWRHGLSV